MLRLTVLAQQAKPGSPLSSILGQQQIKVSDFVVEFNKVSSSYLQGVPLGCRVHKVNTPAKFNLEVCPPTFTVLLRSVATSRSISRFDLYRCVSFRFNTEFSPFALKNVLGTLRSLRLIVR